MDLFLSYADYAKGNALASIARGLSLEVASLTCQAGSDPCPFQACDEVADVCLTVIFADGFESGATSRW